MNIGSKGTSRNTANNAIDMSELELIVIQAKML